jgi:ribosome assembly protein YihI (activator of Der GTPase)
MENERYTDKDCDGLPDFIDSTFDTVDELLEKKGIKKEKPPEPEENKPEIKHQARRSRR